MAEFDFEEFEALNNNIFTGQEEISAREYYKVFSEGIKRNVDRNLFPRNYKYPVGVQFELTYKCNQNVYTVTTNREVYMMRER